MDSLSPQQCSANMVAIHGKHTTKQMESAWGESATRKFFPLAQGT